MRLGEKGLVHMGIERSVGLDLDEPHAVDECRLLVPLGGLERPLQVVEDREELPDEALVGVRDQTLLVARRPLAVVLELGRQTLEVRQVLVSLRLRLSEASGEVLLTRNRKTWGRKTWGRRTWGRRTWGRRTWGRKTWGRKTWGRKTRNGKLRDRKIRGRRIRDCKLVR